MNTIEAQCSDKPIIRVRGLKKAFESQKILDGVDLDIPDKSIFALVGQSGTGKSVLFKTIMGMLSPDAGRVWFRDTELTALNKKALLEARRSFGYAFQYSALFDFLTIEENIAFPLVEVLGMTNQREIRDQVNKMLDWIELPGIGSKRPDQLSGGMRKRVGVARALVMHPEVLFFDEPTTGLDPILSETINDLVIRVNRELGISCILITHDIPAAFRMSDRIAFLDQGKIVAEGFTHNIVTSQEQLVKEFLRISFSELKV